MGVSEQRHLCPPGFLPALKDNCPSNQGQTEGTPQRGLTEGAPPTFWVEKTQPRAGALKVHLEI